MASVQSLQLCASNADSAFAEAQQLLESAQLLHDKVDCKLREFIRLMAPLASFDH